MQQEEKEPVSTVQQVEEEAQLPTPTRKEEEDKDDRDNDAIRYKYNFYAVRKGKTVQCCIFLQWEDCQGQVEDFSEADYSVFYQWQDALDYLNVKPAVTVKSLNKKRKHRTSTSTNVSTSNTIITANKKAKSITTTVSKTTSKNDRNRYYEPLHKLLLEGYLQCRPKGWRRDDLGLTFKEPHKQATQARYLQDLMELRGFLAAAPSNGTTTSTGGSSEDQLISPSQRAAVKAQSDHTILQPHSIRYLNHAWGVNRKYHNDLDDKLHSATGANTTTTAAFTECTIESREAAKMRYTAKKLYLHHRVEELAMQSKLYTTNNRNTRDDDNDDGIDAMNANDNNKTTTTTTKGRDWKRKLQQQAAHEWDHDMTNLQKRIWQEKERLHDQEQPNIKPKLIKALQQDPQRSTAKLIQDIDYWCGRTTVAKWKQTYYFHFNNNKNNKHNNCASRTKARTRDTSNRNRNNKSTKLQTAATSTATNNDKAPPNPMQDSNKKMPTPVLGQPNDPAALALFHHHNPPHQHQYQHGRHRDDNPHHLGQSIPQASTTGTTTHRTNTNTQQHGHQLQQRQPHHHDNLLNIPHSQQLPFSMPEDQNGAARALVMTTANDLEPAATENGYDNGTVEAANEEEGATMDGLPVECTLEETEPVPLQEGEGGGDLDSSTSNNKEQGGGNVQQQEVGYDMMMNDVVNDF